MDVLYALCEKPDLIHACMQTWFELADAVTAKHQQYVTFDEVFISEDICYNNGLLYSPGLMREYLFPYYRQLLANIKSRQLDTSRRLYVQVDTDGRCEDAIDIYHEEIGMDVMSPFEVASGSNVVELGERYPWLVMSGGIDKRVLAQGKDAIDKHIDYIFPAMFKRGGYIPSCDHGVPEEVSLENYLHFRKRCLEYA
jgi:uroporphyrinogen decarboxylase